MREARTGLEEVNSYEAENAPVVRAIGRDVYAVEDSHVEHGVIPVADISPPVFATNFLPLCPNCQVWFGSNLIQRCAEAAAQRDSSWLR